MKGRTTSGKFSCLVIAVLSPLCAALCVCEKEREIFIEVLMCDDADILYTQTGQTERDTDTESRDEKKRALI